MRANCALRRVAGIYLLAGHCAGYDTRQSYGHRIVQISLTVWGGQIPLHGDFKIILDCQFRRGVSVSIGYAPSHNHASQSWIAQQFIAARANNCIETASFWQNVITLSKKSSASSAP